MEKKARVVETADIFVNVRMPPSLVEKLDNCLIDSRLTRSKKVIKAVEFLTSAKICPICNTINAANGKTCSVCGADFIMYDILRSIKAVEYYVDDCRKKHPLNEYSYSFTLTPPGFWVTETIPNENGQSKSEERKVSQEIIDTYSKQVTREDLLNDANLEYVSFVLRDKKR